MKENHYIVIMAGGSGTRLWPMSRKDTPKQFQKFSSNRSLIQETYDRVKILVPKKNIYVSLVENILKTTQEQLKEIPKENFIVEPEVKNTAPATALIAATIFQKNPKAIISTIASDHTFQKIANFQKALNSAATFIESNPDYLVAIGIKPTRPDTGLGYIKVGKKLEGSIFQADTFVEKPNLQTAEKYLSSGKYLWNACYFTFSASGMLKMIEKHQPEIYKGLRQILRDEKVGPIYAKFPIIPIDTAIAEKVKKIAVIPADLGFWSDIGTWSSLYELLSKREGNHTISKGFHIGLDDKNCLVYAQDKLLATVGLEDIIIVDTADVTLVCNKNKTQDVKNLIEKLKQKGHHKYL